MLSTVPPEIGQLCSLVSLMVRCVVSIDFRFFFVSCRDLDAIQSNYVATV